MSGHTPGPWGWQRMGDMKLVGQHGSRPIVLDCVGRRKNFGPPASAEFRLRDAERDLMAPFDESHPDARLIAAAPELLAVLRAVEWSGGMEGTDQDEDDFMVCPCCPSCGVPSSEVGTHEDDPFEPGVHDEGCALAAAIAKAEGR